jgi:hypothetical protein
MSGEGFGGLVPFYDVFVPEHLPINGKRRSRRSAQVVAKKYNLPLVRVGHNVFIDPVVAAERLREAQLVDPRPRGRGRPRRMDAEATA